MKNNMLMALIGVLLFATIAVAQLDKRVISHKADSLLDDAYDKGLFSGLVVISRNGENVYSKQIGFADWQTKRPINKNTLFNIGSLNKRFTEAMIRQLVKENKLSYDDNLSKYLDLYPIEIGSKITIQQLVDMKAGLGDFLRDPYYKALSAKDFLLSDLLGMIRKEPLLFEPGTSQAYSNSGYAVLGAVIEKITGKSYEENLRERIAKPLGLNHLFYTKAAINSQTDRAYGTDVDFDGNKKSTDDVANSTPAGGAYTNMDDLMKFASANLKDAPPQSGKPGIRLFAGGSSAWNSAISYNEQNGFVVVVMANMGDDIGVKIAKRLHSIVLGESFPPLELPFKMALYQTITEKGYAYVKANAEKMARKQRLPYDDHFLNFFANEFLVADKPDIAINLYKANIELFPKSIYTYDVLAEAYLKRGDKPNALKYFKTVLELDPGNQRVKKLVADLESGR